MIKIPIRSPRANSFAERFAGTLCRECLDHVLILGEQHFDKPGRAIDITARIERRRVVGGLISEYRRAA